MQLDETHGRRGLLSRGLPSRCVICRLQRCVRCTLLRVTDLLLIVSNSIRWPLRSGRLHGCPCISARLGMLAFFCIRGSVVRWCRHQAATFKHICSFGTVKPDGDASGKYSGDPLLAMVSSLALHHDFFVFRTSPRGHAIASGCAPSAVCNLSGCLECSSRLCHMKLLRGPGESGQILEVQLQNLLQSAVIRAVTNGKGAQVYESSTAENSKGSGVSCANAPMCIYAALCTQSHSETSQYPATSIRKFRTSLRTAEADRCGQNTNPSP